MVHLTAVLNREYDDRELESLKADIMAFMPYDDLIEKTGGDLDFLDEAILDLASSNGWDIEDAGADAIKAMEVICQKSQSDGIPLECIIHDWITEKAYDFLIEQGIASGE